MRWTGPTALTWNAVPGAASYDLIKGDLLVLRSSGSFAVSILACLENDGADQAAVDPAVPAPGNGFYYLVRPSGGTWDCACPSQAGPRDADIQTSPLGCP